MPTLEVGGGVSLYYEEKGAGPTVVFAHGIPTDYRAWENQTNELSKDFRAVSYSRRYAWPNKREGDVSDSTIQNNAFDLKRFIEALGAGSVHLVGHSYGGFVAAYLAAENHDLLKSLVLVEPATATLLIEDETSSSQLFSLLLRSPSVALSARRFKNGSLKPSLEALGSGKPELAVVLNVDGIQDRADAFKAFPEAVRAMMLDNAKTIAELGIKLPSFKEKAAKITTRTMVVNGHSSALWLRRTGELTARAIPKTEHVVIPNSRHFPHMENPAEFNRWLRTFIAEGKS